MEHSMRTMTRTIALAFVLFGLASAPLAAQANPPPPSSPLVAQPTGPQYQGPPPQAPQAQSPQPQGPQYSSNEIVDAGQRFFGTISRELAQIVEKAGSQFGLPNGYVLGQRFRHRRRGRHSFPAHQRRSGDLGIRKRGP